MKSFNKPLSPPINSFEFAVSTKPIKALKSLFDVFIQTEDLFSLQAGNKYYFSSKKELSGIILLQNGIASLCHSENDMHMSTYFSPSVLGLVDGYSLFYDVPARAQHYMLAEIDCTCCFIPINKFVELSDKHNLWHDISRVLAHRLMVMSAREQELVGVDSYLQVKTLLIELWGYPIEYRENINALNFILKRTLLSRSRVLAIFSALKKGGYIEIKFGKLTGITKLPHAY